MTGTTVTGRDATRASATAAEGDLVVRARRGDPLAWGELYGRWELAIYNFVLHRVGRDRAVADDVFQETFCRAVERLDQFDPERGDFGAWLHGVARNEVRQHHRRAKRRPGASATAAAEEPSGATGSDVERRLALGELVNLAASRLSSEHQRVLAWKYQDGLSLEEIAGRLDSSGAAVGSLLYRARSAFREAFALVERDGDED